MKEKIEGEFPVEFLERYGPALHTATAVLGEMAAKGEVENVYHAAHVFRLMVGAAEAVALKVRERKVADEWRPRFVI